MFQEIADSFHGTLHDFTPAAPITDRCAWDALAPDIREELIADAEPYLHFVWPVLTATDYLDFTRTGNRSRYQDKLFARRTVLNTLVLAECAQQKGRFLDDILNGVYAICEESAWQLPAHNSYIRDTPQLPLPDVTRPVLDLFAAETGAILAMTDYLLRDAFQAVSPFITVMIRHALETRVFTPYQTEHFWWMGDGKSHMNNWTVWCTQNTLIAAFACPMSRERRQEILKKAAVSLDYFLDEYGEDGCCDEGAQYYRHAGLCLFNCLEVLNGVTDGAFASLYRETKIRNIAEYIRNVHIEDEYYVNFADCSPVAGRCDAREFLFGKRVESPTLMDFAARDYRRRTDRLIPEEHNLFYRLQSVFHAQEILEYPLQENLPQKDFYFPSSGLFLARGQRFCLAVKAGDNDDSHNHNDTGSFTIYQDGKPLFVDIGVESYTRKTFSPQRYEIWTMQSQYHNLPTFQCPPPELMKPGSPDAGIMQMDGPEYRATDVSCHFGEDTCSISMDIADAYPNPGIRSYVRRAVLKKASPEMKEAETITISDHYDGDLRPAVQSLITYEKPEWDEAAKILRIGENGSCRISGAGSVSIQELPITDERLKTAWKHNLYRTLVTLDGPDLTLVIH
ncbi:MAG: heparinase II/III family protein [Lachnospiraceae bacterium]|nr:heparinase II/III family protein [Lachnospiraceae bacterium]